MLEKSLITFMGCFTDAPKFVPSSVGCISQRRESGNSGCLGGHGATHSITHFVEDYSCLFSSLVSPIFLGKKVNQSRYRREVPRGFQEIKVPRLRDNGTGWW